MSVDPASTWPSEGRPAVEPIPILTPAQAAKILKVSMPVIYEALRSGQIPSFRVGRQVRIGAAALYRHANQINPRAESRPQHATWPSK